MVERIQKNAFIFICKSSIFCYFVVGWSDDRAAPLALSEPVVAPLLAVPAG
jgi:hypothetical protein